MARVTALWVSACIENARRSPLPGFRQNSIIWRLVRDSPGRAPLQSRPDIPVSHVAARRRCQPRGAEPAQYTVN